MQDLQTRRAFVTVAREGSVSRAAERLHLTQPAVSLKLKQFQTHLGLPRDLGFYLADPARVPAGTPPASPPLESSAPST